MRVLLSGFGCGPVLGRSRLGRGDVAACVALFAAALAVEAYLAFRFRDLGVYAWYNVFFDADPNERLADLAHGYNGRSLIHPNLGNFFSIPLRAIAKAFAMAGLIAEEEPFREYLALWIVPLLTAAKTAVLFLTFRRLGASLYVASGVGVLALVSMSQLLFGALPDHFAISGALIVFATYYALRVLERPDKERDWIWAALAFLMIGVTSFNALFFLALYVAAGGPQGSPFLTRAIRGSVIAAICGAAALALSLATRYALTGAIADADDVSTNPYFFFARAIEQLGRFPLSLALTLAAPEPGVIDNALALKTGQGLGIQFTYEHLQPLTHGLIPAFGAAALLLGAALGAARLDARWRALIGASLAILTVNWLFHGVFGSEQYLFSQHWHSALLMLVAAVFHAGEKGAAALSRSALTLGALFALLMNATTLSQILDRLAAG